MKLLDILKSQIFIYIATKYLTYSLQFFVALLIAKYLGLFYFGIYGFATLILQYLSYTNVGINHSFNVIMSTQKVVSKNLATQLLSTSIFTSLLIGILLVLILGFGYFFNLFQSLNKYLFNDYSLIVIAIVVTQHVNIIYVALFRIYGQLNEINLYYLTIPLFQLFCIFFFKDINLFWALMISTLVGNVISFFLFYYRAPAKISIKSWDQLWFKKLIKRGSHLLIYNLSFYLIIIAARSLVSYYYSVEEFGLFSFANSLSQAIILLLGSINFLFYPKFLNKISVSKSNSELIVFIEKIRTHYLTLTFLLVFLTLLIIPILYFFLPSYKGSALSFKYLLLAQLVFNNSFGYTTLMVQKQKEKQLSIIGFLSVGVVLLLGITLRYSFEISFNYIALVVMLSALIYTHLVVVRGNKITKQFHSHYDLLKYIYNFRLFGPLVIYGILSLTSIYEVLNVCIALGIYLVLNYQDLLVIIKNVISLIGDSEVLKIKSTEL